MAAERDMGGVLWGDRGRSCFGGVLADSPSVGGRNNHTDFDLNFALHGS